MSNFLQEINEFTKTINTYPYCMYGTYTRLGFKITVNGGLCVQLAPALDPNKKGKPTAGEAIYDNDKQLYFTLLPTECHDIINNIKSVLSGAYESKNPSVDEKYKNIFQITHYSDNGSPSRLTLQLDKNKNLKLTIISAEGTNLSFVLTNKNSNPKYADPYQISIFVDLVSNCAKNNIYNDLLFKSKVNMFRQAYFKHSSDNNSGGGNNYNNNYKNKNNKNDNVDNDNEPVRREHKPPVKDDDEEEIDIQDFLNDIDI